MPSIFTRRTRDYFQGLDGEQYDKFSTKNKPTKTMFRRLFEAVGFMNESSDTAQTDVQGFVQINTDAEASAKNSIASANGFTKVVQAHHLPHLIEDANVDNPDGAGDENNAFSVRKISTNYGRTGGSGDTYILKNTMAVSAHEDLDFVTVTQSAAGTNVELGFNSENFDTKVGETSTISTINTNINALKRGFLGEIKMYSFLNESLGQTNCEFDGQGVGRSAGSNGASGQWAGWVVLMGQSAGILKGTPYSAPDEIIDRITTGGFIVDTKQMYPSGIASSVTAENAGFKSVGANTHTLTTGETPVKSHSHGVSGVSVEVQASLDSRHYHHIPASNNSQVSESFSKFDMFNNGDVDNLKDGYTGSQAADVAGLDGEHTHTSAVTGSVDATENSTATAHNNRPLSFVVCYVMYIGTVGSPN